MFCIFTYIYGMIPRQLSEKILYFSQKYPIVTITGPRQSGKTTLIQHLFKDHAYYSIENPMIRDLVQEDPAILFQPAGKKIIIDEVQRMPELLSYIQVEADRQRINGQFILTGSQSLLLSEKISQTLAGRTAILKLLPFSLIEIQPRVSNPDAPYENWIHRGFYPRIYDQHLGPSDFYPFYFETYIQRDVRELQQVRDLNLFSNFVRLCVGRVGQLLDYSSLANDAGVSVNTARGWISLLEASFVVTLLHPYHKNLNKRVIKSPKLYFLDVGLAAFLLNIQDPLQLSNHYLKGYLFENLVLVELLKRRYNQGQLSNLYFFRDSNKNEVDCILDDGEMKAIEIKSSRTFSNSFADGLLRFSKAARIRPENCFIVYGGDEGFTFKGVNVVSWKALDQIPVSGT